VSITTECLFSLSRRSSSWWLSEQRRDMVQAVNSRSEGAIRRAQSWAEHPHHRWAESLSVFRRVASVHPLVRAPAGDHDNHRYAAPKEAATAALLVIGNKILSGRTKDQNIGYIAEYLTALGIELRKCGWSAMKRQRSSTRSTHFGSATPMFSPLAALGRGGQA
jgi:hypothetical protein